MRKLFALFISRTAFSFLTVILFCEPPSYGRDREADIAKVVGFDSSEMVDGAPAGWAVERYRGETDLKMERDAAGVFLRMASRGDQAFGVKKECSLDLATFPFLNWRWRVHKLPLQGDVRHADRDDQALQVYVIFKRAGMAMTLQPPAVAYVWDNEAPKGITTKSSQRLMGMVRYVVMRDRTDVLGQWHSEKRNLLEDGKNAFPEYQKETFPRWVRGVLLFINTHHTKGAAAGDVGDVCFSRQ